MLKSLVDDHPIIKEIIDYRSTANYGTILKVFSDGKVHTI